MIMVLPLLTNIPESETSRVQPIFVTFSYYSAYYTDYHWDRHLYYVITSFMHRH
jgi:hypothetical protein